jgi:hypothetical protein
MKLPKPSLLFARNYIAFLLDCITDPQRTEPSKLSEVLKNLGVSIKLINQLINPPVMPVILLTPPLLISLISKGSQVVAVRNFVMGRIRSSLL